ncbi:MAG: hypothetical protein HYS05_06240 [Acidobacteria bacterium]|nr:hypothetical protein [Acidobacteriota bacterium]
MRAPRALPGGRLDAQDDTFIPFRALTPGATKGMSTFTPEATIGPFYPGIFVSQMNDMDFIHLIIPEADRSRVIGQPIDAGHSNPNYRFDIVVRGRFQTPLDSDVHP